MVIYFFSHFSFVSFLNLMKAQVLGRNVGLVDNGEPLPKIGIVARKHGQ